MILRNVRDTTTPIKFTFWTVLSLKFCSVSTPRLTHFWVCFVAGRALKSLLVRGELWRQAGPKYKLIVLLTTHDSHLKTLAPPPVLSCGNNGLVMRLLRLDANTQLQEKHLSSGRCDPNPNIPLVLIIQKVENRAGPKFWCSKKEPRKELKIRCGHVHLRQQTLIF